MKIQFALSLPSIHYTGLCTGHYKGHCSGHYKGHSTGRLPRTQLITAQFLTTRFLRTVTRLAALTFALTSAVSLALPLSAQARTHQPTARKTQGISFAILQLQDSGYSTLKDLKNAFVGPNLTARVLPRYAYSPKWGWIDFKHFFTAAYYSSLPLVPPQAVLIEGEKTEKAQEKNGENSAWSYEDLPSNLLGAYLAVYLRRNPPAPELLLDGVRSYLLTLGFSEDPLRVAPNGSYLIEQEAAGIDLESMKAAIENRDYMPNLTLPGIELNELDQDIIRFRTLYLLFRAQADSKN